MAETKHTLEPWDDSTALLIRAGSSRLQLGTVREPPKYDCRVLVEENYQRAVACVNACAGLADPEQAVSDLLAAAEAHLEMFGRHGEGRMERFERVGELFYADTGLLRPGKDDSADSDLTYAEREREFRAWTDGRREALRAALAKARGGA